MTKAQWQRAEAYQRKRAVEHLARLRALVAAVERARESGGLKAVVESGAWAEARRFKAGE